MRHSKTIQLDETRTATVNELRVKDVRQLLSGFNDLSAVNITELFGPRFAEISDLVAPLITLPNDETLDDLTGSEIEQVLEAFKEVNRAFLVLAGMAPATMIPLSNSISPAADLSNAATPGVLTTDGGFS